jgi:hypothetical protein
MNTDLIQPRTTWKARSRPCVVLFALTAVVMVALSVGRTIGEWESRQHSIEMLRRRVQGRCPPLAICGGPRFCYSSKDSTTEEIRRAWFPDQDFKGLIDYLGGKRIAKIDCGMTAINDTDITYILNFRHVSYLSLKSTRVTDVSLKSVGTIATLRTLDIRDTQITSAAIDALSRARPDLVIICE